LHMACAGFPLSCSLDGKMGLAFGREPLAELGQHRPASPVTRSHDEAENDEDMGR
jgi:hypothetical protein